MENAFGQRYKNRKVNLFDHFFLVEFPKSAYFEVSLRTDKMINPSEGHEYLCWKKLFLLQFVPLCTNV